MTMRTRIARADSFGLTDNTVFASVIEPHGSYSPVSELALDSNSSISELRVIHDDEDYTAVTIVDVEGRSSHFIVANADASASSEHELTIGDTAYSWTGPFFYGRQ